MRRRLLSILVVLLALSPAALSQDTPETAEQQVIARCNQFRQQNGLPALAVSSSLRTAARTHSEEMARLGYFDHESPVVARRYPWDRVALAGADADSMAENIFEANGAPLPQVPAVCVTTWEKSPEHRGNLLDPSKTHVGVGIWVVGKRTWVTQVLSSPVTDR